MIQASDTATSKINHFRSDPTGWAGAAAMAGFGLYAGWRFSQSGLIFFLLLVLRDFAAAWFLLVRRPAGERRGFDVLAYVSSALPLAYAGASGSADSLGFLAANFLAIVGFALSTVALFELGPSFGVAAANRGRVGSGVYRLLRHPMYIGYGIAELGMVVLSPANFVLYALSILLYGRRAIAESRLIEPHPANGGAGSILTQSS
jgi:hypothetical protein